MPCTLRNNAQLFIASGLGLHCSKVRPLPALEFSVSSSTIVRIADLVLNLQTTSVPLKFMESHHFREKQFNPTSVSSFGICYCWRKCMSAPHLIRLVKNVQRATEKYFSFSVTLMRRDWRSMFCLHPLKTKF